jgi:conjugal transfer/entry exclusion protein
MKFTVEVEDFYIEQGDLAEELKSQVKADVVRQMKDSLKKQVDDFMDRYIKSEINDQVKGRVQSTMDDFLATGKIKEDYGNQEMTVEAYIAKALKARHADIQKAIADQVKKQVTELQNRYDMLFATQLISKIKDSGFLKDDAAKLLLSTEGGN